MANLNDLNLTPLDQLDWELMLRMDLAAFSPVAGFNIAQPRPLPDQNPFVGFLSYNTTFHQNVLANPNSGPDNLRWDSATVPVPERQPTFQQPDNFETYVAAQQDDGPAWSDSSALVGLNESNSTLNHASELTIRSGNKNSYVNQASSARSRAKEKRKLEDHMGCFSVRSNAEGSRRKRQAFDPAKRKDVALMRKVKPCSRCKARRVKVSLGQSLLLPSHLLITTVSIPWPMPSLQECSREHHSRKAYLHPSNAAGSPLRRNKLW